MIPKIIHYVWLGGNEFPKKIQQSIDSWKKVLPDYQLVLWDDQRVHALNNKWCEEAILCKKYAFAADYVRFYAVYNYGGIWLDTDVEVVKSFDELLSLSYFIGKEYCGSMWGSGIFGAEKGTNWIKTCLDYYNKKSFINIFGEMQTHILPWIMNKCIRKHYQIKECDTIADWVSDKDVVCIFPEDWFSPKKWDDKDEDIVVTSNTFSIHHFTATWQKKNDTIIPLTLSQRILGWCKKRASFVKHQILHL